MTRAKEAGISDEDAAVAFGCNPDMMRKHYVALDETLIADRVMEAIQGEGVGLAAQANREEQPVGHLESRQSAAESPLSEGGPDQAS